MNEQTTKQQAREIAHAKRKIAFRMIEYIIEHAENPGSLRDEIDELAKFLSSFIPSTAAEAEIEIDAIGKPLPVGRCGQSAIAELKALTGASDAIDAIRKASAELAALRSQVVPKEDDSFSISIEWLKEIGFRESSDSCIAVESPDNVLLLSNWGFEWTVCNGRPKATTRGEVRALCKALSITLAEVPLPGEQA